MTLSLVTNTFFSPSLCLMAPRINLCSTLACMPHEARLFLLQLPLAVHVNLWRLEIQPIANIYFVLDAPPPCTHPHSPSTLDPISSDVAFEGFIFMHFQNCSLRNWPEDMGKSMVNVVLAGTDLIGFSFKPCFWWTVCLLRAYSHPHF